MSRSSRSTSASGPAGRLRRIPSSRLVRARSSIVRVAHSRRPSSMAGASVMATPAAAAGPAPRPLIPGRCMSAIPRRMMSSKLGRGRTIGTLLGAVNERPAGEPGSGMATPLPGGTAGGPPRPPLEVAGSCSRAREFRAARLAAPARNLRAASSRGSIPEMSSAMIIKFLHGYILLSSS